jgi:UDP-GlcNAc:undecaprenyl-phosphate GlcNAc-1-phosphate transferase
VHEYLQYFLILLVTAAVTYVLTPLVRQAAIRLGAVLPARDRDVHAAPIPRMGGVAMYAGLAAGLLVATRLVPLRDNLPGTGIVSGLLGAGGLIVLVGMIDDRWGISAIGKLAGQVAAAGVLFYSGAQLTTFPLPTGVALGPYRGYVAFSPGEALVLTIVVVVATINAVNFIDGLDGLAAGIVFIAAVSFFVYYFRLTQVLGFQEEAVPALAAALLAGACLGFLPHNFYPAKIFMGDTGSMLLGLVLAYVPIQALSTLDYSSLHYKANRFAALLPLLLPAMVMVIPYSDMLRAVIRRTRAGLSPFAADRKHLHHRMLEIGHSHLSSVLILYAWAAVFSGTVIGLSIVTVPLVVLAAATMGAVLVLVLLSIPKLRWWQSAQTPGQPAVSPAQPAVSSVPPGQPAVLPGQPEASAGQSAEAPGNGQVGASAPGEPAADAPLPAARASGKIIP